MVFWDDYHDRTHTQFLQDIDPGYFSYVSQILHADLDGPNGMQAAIGLRSTYSHALESFFAILGAAIQAPHCPTGWLLKYQVSNLRSLVHRITNREPFYTKLRIDTGGWSEVVDSVSPWREADEQFSETIAASARLWSVLARDYLDPQLHDEHNSLKHGHRVKSGSWFFAMGTEDTPGVPAPAERMRTVAQSNYGSTFIRPVRIKPKHWSFEEQRINWNPSVFAKRIPLIVHSIDNVLSFLKLANGLSPDKLQIALLTTDEVEEAILNPDHSTSVRFSIRHSNFTSEDVPDPTKEEMIETYLQALGNDDENQPSAP
jgi:hypothetical protein